MLCALVETFGKELKIGKKEIGEYFKEHDFDVLSPSLPFKNIESKTCFIVLFQACVGEIEAEGFVYLGYWIGTSDVPSIPTILVGKPREIPINIKRSLSNLFCVEENNIGSVLDPLVSAFSESKEILETASESSIQKRIQLRERLVGETLKAMKEHKYSMEEYKGKL
jgi:hypothetical protein